MNPSTFLQILSHLLSIKTPFSFFCARSDMLCGQVRLDLSLNLSVSCFVESAQTSLTLVSCCQCAYLKIHSLHLGREIYLKHKKSYLLLKNVLSHSIHSSACTWLQISAGCRANARGKNRLVPSVSTCPFLSALLSSKEIPLALTLGVNIHRFLHCHTLRQSC